MLPEKRSENGNETIADREGSQAGAKDQDQVECLSQEPTATEKKDFFLQIYLHLKGLCSTQVQMFPLFSCARWSWSWSL